MRTNMKLKSILLIMLSFLLVFSAFSCNFYDEAKNGFSHEKSAYLDECSMQNQSYIYSEKAFGYKNITTAVSQKRNSVHSKLGRYIIAFLFLFLLLGSYISVIAVLGICVPINCSSIFIIHYIHSIDGQK